MSATASPPELLLQLAREMLGGGWQPVWCLVRQSGAFTPIPGTTGGSAPFPSIEPQPSGAHRLAFRPPPEVIVFDVDHYDAKRGMDTIDKAEAWLGDLPDTWRVTSRGYDNPSGRYLYRKPADLDFTDSALAQFADEDGNTHVEIVRTAHRFSWAPGDTNHKNGRNVQCFDPDGELCLLPSVDELPELPDRWIAYLRNPPVPQHSVAYTRPSDGPLWWLSQADNSLGSRAELAQFAFDLLASRVAPDDALEQLRRVSYAADPARPWQDSDFYGLVDANTQRKTDQLLQYQDADTEYYEEGLGVDVQGLGARTQEAYERQQRILATVEPSGPLTPREHAAVEAAAGIAGVYLPDGDEEYDPAYIPPSSKLSPIQELHAHPDFERQLWNELLRQEARKAALKALAAKFEGYKDISALPEPPEPATFIVTGKDEKHTCVVPPGTITVMSGHRAAGKTWAVATWAAQELRAGHHVMWIDFERQARALNSKLKTLGIKPHVIRDQVHYTDVLPSAETLSADVMQYATATGRVLMVVDAFRGLQNTVAPETSANDGDAVEQVYLEYLNPLCEAGATIALLDHLAKTGQGGTFGSERKESAADLVFRVEQVHPFTKKTPGFSELTCTKDRYGLIEAGSPVGYLWMPGDGSKSAADGFMKYPELPELRNWSPQADAELAQMELTKQGERNVTLTELVSESPLKYSINSLAREVMEAYPEQFGSESTAKRCIRELIKAGGLEHEGTGSDARLNVPAQATTVTGTVKVDPAALELPEDGE